MSDVDRYSVRIPAGGDTMLEAELSVPERARAVILYGNVCGAGRHSPRNTLVTRYMNEADPPLATLLVDLLTEEEDEVDMNLRFDKKFLARRFAAAADWLTTSDRTRGLAIGCCAASTGVPAALEAAAARPFLQAVVARGGRPDLAASVLPRVHAPTLLIVGGEDKSVLDANRDVVRFFRVDCRLDVIPGASHVFEEPGAMLEVARRSTRWFHDHLNGLGLAAGVARH